MAKTTEKNVVLYTNQQVAEDYRFRNSRSNENPQCLAHQEPRYKCRNVIRIEFAKRLDGKPLKPNPQSLPKPCSDIQKIFSCRSMCVW